jgi:hypothetical protein
MKISDERKMEIYSAIHNKITDLRVELQKEGLGPKLDFKVAQIIEPIYQEVKKALNVE